MNPELHPTEALRALAKHELAKAAKRVVWALGIGILLLVVTHGLGDRSGDYGFVLMLAGVGGLIFAALPFAVSRAALHFSYPEIFEKSTREEATNALVRILRVVLPIALFVGWSQKSGDWMMATAVAIVGALSARWVLNENFLGTYDLLRLLRTKEKGIPAHPTDGAAKDPETPTP
jgi:hypothetical protein